METKAEWVKFHFLISFELVGGCYIRPLESAGVSGICSYLYYSVIPLSVFYNKNLTFGVQARPISRTHDH